MNQTLLIEEWSTEHPRWAELIEAVEALEQTAWVAAHYPFHRSSHMLVAGQNATIAGFLRFVTQVIGDDDDLAPVTLDGTPLIEAKVMAFGALPRYRQQGIGRALQEHALVAAKQLGCYQLRSHSSGSNTANHRLKLRMGFGVHPVLRGDDRQGVYFVIPLTKG